MGNKNVTRISDLKEAQNQDEEKQHTPKPIKFHFDKTLYRNSDNAPPTPNVLFGKGRDIDFKVDRRSFESIIRNMFSLPPGNIVDTGESLNVGIIPVEIVQNLLYFCELSEVLSVALTCRTFHAIFKTERFWEKYYHIYFGLHQRNKELDEEDDAFYGFDKNWKQEFYTKLIRRKTQTDEYYRKKYTLVTSKEEFLKTESSNIRQFSFGNILILGHSKVGKTKFLDNLFSTNNNNISQQQHIPTGMKERQITFYYRTKREKYDDLLGCVSGSIWEIGGSVIDENERLIDLRFSNPQCCGLFLCLTSSIFEDNSNNAIKRQIEFAKKMVRMFESKGKSVEGIVLMLLKSDLTSKRKKKKKLKDDKYLMFMREIRKFLKKSGIVQFVEVSSLENRNVYKAFGMMMDSVIGRMKAKN